jgi:cytoskeletal protein CcmA (bactofilin family)
LEIKVVKKNDIEDNTTDNQKADATSGPMPFVKPTAQTKTVPFNPELLHRPRELPGGPRRSDHPMTITSEANKLTVGKNISLNGEILACEKLIVEGQVEATLRDAHIIDVSEGGCFKGNADVAEAYISGTFIGTLVVKDLLTIRKSGQVEGSIRYGRIIIDAGGIITGDMASLEDEKQKPNSSDRK